MSDSDLRSGGGDEGGRSSAPIGGISSEEFLFLNRQLASILRLELPLAQGLRSMAKEVRKPNLRRLVDSIRDDLDQGRPLTTALSKYPKDFPPLYVEILRAGEESGDLPSVLDQLAEYNQTMADTKMRVQHALTYPVFVASMLFVLVLFILVFLIPNFKQLFEELGMDGIPPTTKAIFAASDFLRNWKISIPVVGVLGVIGMAIAFRIREGVRNVDQFVFRFPVMGKVLRLAALLKICRTFSELLRTGVGLVTALRLTANTAGNNTLRETLLKMRDSVEEGRRFSAAASDENAFPPTMVWKMTMAEERGMVEDAFEEMAQFYERELISECSHIENVLGPVLVIFISLVVGGIVISLYMPLLQMHAAAQGM